MDDLRPLLPAPRCEADLVAPSYPPGPRRWAGQAPISQSRGGYTSPDPSPASDKAFPAPEPPSLTAPRGFRFSPPEFYEEYGHGHGHEHGRDHLLRGSGHGLHGMGRVEPFLYPVMPQRHQRNGGHSLKDKRGSARKVDGKQPTFLTKLYSILNQPEYASIIRWDEAGEVIIIEKPDELADNILPLVYRQSRFASFSRQLNIYGFMRKVSLRHVDREICDPDASTWSHPFLRRSSTAAEVQGFKRRVPPRPPQSSKRRESAPTSNAYDDGVPGLSPTSSENSYQSPPDRYQHRLLPDLEEEKPAIFHPPQDHIQESSSPSSSEDHGMTSRRRRLSYGRTSRTIQGPGHDEVPHLPTLLFEHNPRGTATIPASAPAYSTSFTPLSQINQGHVRTRSNQGEPPSASLFSATSPLAQESWLPPLDESDPFLRGDNSAVPTYDANDASTWSQHGMRDIPSNKFIGRPQHRLGAIPSSVPNDFSPVGYTHPTSSGSDSFAAGPAGTVSPGVYQTGLAPVTSTPHAVPMRQERPASISSSPYSGRSRPSAIAMPLGPTRGVSGRRESGDEPDGVGVNEEEALPSAGLRTFDRGPFEGVLRDPDYKEPGVTAE